MDISLRLKSIVDMVVNTNTVADIGTDHGYIPIYLVKQGKCNNAIATDINEGPTQKAQLNVIKEGLKNKIQCRQGPGLKAIKTDKVDVIIIAGMGGNLIRDIIEEEIDVFKSADYAILQPVQNPDILRKYLILSGFNIIDEELVKEDNKFYEIIKVSSLKEVYENNDDFYEIGKKLIEKKHPLASEYINFKINKYNKIICAIHDETELACKKKLELKERIKYLEELLVCL